MQICSLSSRERVGDNELATEITDVKLTATGTAVSTPGGETPSRAGRVNNPSRSPVELNDYVDDEQVVAATSLAVGVTGYR